MLSRKTKLFIVLLVAILPLLAGAADPTPPRGFLDNISCIRSGLCGLDDIANGFVELIKMLLGLMGSVALVYFVWGGIVWITAGGNMEKIGRGRSIMVNTILAIVVSFSSYIILNTFVNNLLGANTNFQVSDVCPVTEGDNTPCKNNSPSYICYQGACRTKCDILNAKIQAEATSDTKVNIDPTPVVVERHGYVRGDSLACERVETIELRNTAHFTELCPGDNNFVCVFRQAGRKVLPPIPAP
ncbi:MAG: hypothetical protein C3F02_01900 [Parcubacteria group bacterium]|nr:MAG: hypothetical protein C3F02_01900 [Parcubacteria group bacterium]